MINLHITVPLDFKDSQRIDQYVASIPNGMNRSKLKSGLEELLLNGKSVKLSAKVKAGDKIDILWEDNIPVDIQPENIPLKILYEDENVTVINKAQGMVTHPAAGNWSGTLVNALLFHWNMKAVPQLKEAGENEKLKLRRPGIVHRLDKDTSGIIITARNRDAEEWLCAQFKERLTRKEYICIVKGKPPASSGDVKSQIVRDIKNRQKFKAVTGTKEGKYARTLYHCIACYGPYSLIKVRIKTGRTHQIRVHMRYLGCPIVGDSIYGKKDEQFPYATLMLHSKSLMIKLPKSEKYTRFRTRVPVRFKKMISELKKMYPKEVMPKVKNRCKKLK